MLRLDQITKTYSDGTRALDGISLDVSQGMVGLLGPNGAGKTTLLSILNLAQEPSSGRRTYGELDDRPAHRAAIRRMLGYLPQEFDPVSGLTGFEYLELCGRVRRVPLSRHGLRRRIAALLEAVELQDAAHRRADRYSGGMIRRLGLAQAILHSPKLLVVDEPTAGLDPDERIRFRNLVTDLADEIPVLLSTHIVEDIEATCPRLVIIARGRLLFDDGPGVLMRRAEGKLFEIDADAPVDQPGLVAIGRRVDDAGIATRVVHAEEAPVGARPIEPALEEACSAFLALEAHQSLDDTENETEDVGGSEEEAS